MRQTMVSTSVHLRLSVGIDIGNQSYDASLGQEQADRGINLGKTQSFSNETHAYPELIRCQISGRICQRLPLCHGSHRGVL
ncbi:MAG: hypothetical protein R3B93_07780 [Bacteroidia bacterium]